MPSRSVTQPTRPTSFRALLAYLGGKRRLAPLILAAAGEALPADTSRPIFLDPFGGGGAVALQAKALGYQTIGSDLGPRAAIVARVLIASSTRRLEPADLFPLAAAAMAEREPGAPAARAVLPPTQARFLTAAFRAATTQSDPLRSLFQLVLIKLLRGGPMALANAADAKYAAADDGDRVSSRPRRFRYQPGRTANLSRANPP